jgi:hypothetical protein
MLRSPFLGRFDQSFQRLERKRLRDLPDHARPYDGAGIDVDEARGEDDGNARKSHRNLIDQPHAIIAGHAHVAEDERHLTLFEHAKRRMRISRVLHHVSHGFDATAEQIPDAAVIVNDQN